MTKKALIIGITGQDGAYLAQHLLAKGYIVTGSSRDVMASSFSNLNTLGIREQVKLISVSINDFRSVFRNLQPRWSNLGRTLLWATHWSNWKYRYWYSQYFGGDSGTGEVRAFLQCRIKRMFRRHWYHTR